MAGGLYHTIRTNNRIQPRPSSGLCTPEQVLQMVYTRLANTFCVEESNEPNTNWQGQIIGLVTWRGLRTEKNIRLHFIVQYIF